MGTYSKPITDTIFNVYNSTIGLLVVSMLKDGRFRIEVDYKYQEVKSNWKEVEEVLSSYKATFIGTEELPPSSF